MLKTKPSMAIVILAAGASRRMGAPKQLLKWGENTLLEHVIHSALQLNAQEVIVVLGANYDSIKTRIEQYPITILNNTDWKVGLGKSIAFAAAYLTKSKNKMDGVLITLADQPLIDVDFLEGFLHKFKSQKNTIIATSYGNDKYGVPVLFGAKYFEALSKLNTDNGAKHILEKYKIYVKTIAHKNKTVDLDSKEEYERLYKAKFNDYGI